MFSWFVFGVFSKVAKVLKCLFSFSQFWLLGGTFLLDYLGLESLGEKCPSNVSSKAPPALDQHMGRLREKTQNK